MDGQNNSGRSFEPKWTVMAHDPWVNIDGHSTSGPKAEDVRGRGLQGLDIGRGRGRLRTTVFNIFIC